MDENRGLASLFDKLLLQAQNKGLRDSVEELEPYAEKIEKKVMTNFYRLIDFQKEISALRTDTALEATCDIIQKLINHESLDLQESESKYFWERIINKESNWTKIVSQNFAFCFLSIVSAISCTQKEGFYYKIESVHYWHDLFLESFGSLVAIAKNRSARAKSLDNLDKQHSQNRMIKLKVFQLWEQGNLETGRAWRKYSDCAKYAIDHLGFKYDQGTVERWLSRQYSPKKQIATNKKLD